MSATNGVFTRGRMRLYLLKLLDERPRHGYEILQLLEERLGGTYAPSPGSVYPRLRRLEADGLVDHDEQGGRKVYRLTDKGRQEVAARAEEMAELESDIRSVSDLADDVAEDVRSAVRDIGGEISSSAGEPQRRQRWRRGKPGQQSWPESIEFSPSGGMIDAQLHVLVAQVRELAAKNPPTSAQIGQCAAILDEAYRRIAEALTEPE
ncbi:MAG TPA: PadR family transcriptional regulator [Pseudonocardiaceae bacterium]|nr:PadR family transcriptional regulator [Pseudonocardiaceae bacterium]